MAGVAGRLLGTLPSYIKHAWWGLVAPLTESEDLIVVQAVIRSEEGLLLAIRSEPRGWELPGGNLDPGESEKDGLEREVREETGLDVRIERFVGEYRRTGFRPHVAKVYECRQIGGQIQPSTETPDVRWWKPDQLPTTLFPWYLAPIADTLAELGEPVKRQERQGAAAIAAALRIDLRMRLSGDRAV